jgi:hypothetical protein
MSPPHIAPMQTAYTPVSDAHDRHEAGVTKNRKAASTGGGRAWSEDEVRLAHTFDLSYI